MQTLFGVASRWILIYSTKNQDWISEAQRSLISTSMNASGGCQRLSVERQVETDSSLILSHYSSNNTSGQILFLLVRFKEQCNVKELEKRGTNSTEVLVKYKHLIVFLLLYFVCFRWRLSIRRTSMGSLTFRNRMKNNRGMHFRKRSFGRDSLQTLKSCSVSIRQPKQLRKREQSSRTTG